MLAVQSLLIDISLKFQKDKDDRHMVRNANQLPTEFPINSLVLVKYPKTAFGHKLPTKLHAIWQGPFRVVNFEGTVYTLQSLVDMKNRDVHVSLLKAYEHDPEHTDPRQVALTDKQQFIVEEIRRHFGTPLNKSNFRFEVKWQDYPESENTIVYWRDLIHNKKLHDYLRKTPKLLSSLPIDYRTEQDKAILTKNKRQKKQKGKNT